MERYKKQTIIGVFVAGTLLAGCAETQLAIHTTKQIQRANQGDSRGIYKVGRPYRINGVWYYPSADYNYVETGIASWYGAKFHRRATANGEVFNMNALSAAHRTLPLPSLVRVTNLENGRSLVLRVNDRGPFANGRIIDVSRRGAQLLGFYGKGTARVRVRILSDESRQLASIALTRGTAGAKIAAKMPAVPRIPVKANTLPGSIAPTRPATVHPVLGRAIQPSPRSARKAAWGKDEKPTGTVTRYPVRPTRIFVQAGAFIRYENASKLRSKLGRLAHASVAPVQVGAQRFYRVRLGPLNNVRAADIMLARLISSGHDKAKIVVD